MWYAAPAVLTLIDDYDEIVIRPERTTAANPIHCREWDLGAPDIRQVVADKPGADGVNDRTAFTGGRNNITFDLAITGDATNSPYAWAERLIAMTHPHRRPLLRARRHTPEAEGQTWDMRLVGAPFAATFGRKSAALLELQLAFTSPDGYFLGDWQTYESAYADGIATTGMTFPAATPLTFISGVAQNPYITATVGGSAPINPVIYIYGPVTNPEVRTAGNERFGFTGLTLATGEFVQIDMGSGRVLLGGSISASLHHLVNWNISSFWRWLPGAHTVRYLGAGGRIAVQYRDRRYLI